MNNQDKRGSFFYTLLGYVVILLTLGLITLVLGIGMYLSGFLRLMVSVSHDTFVKWLGFTFYTPLTFWVVVKFSRQRWHNKVFWWTMGSLLFVHIGGFLAIFRYVEHWRLLYSAAICMVEAPIIGIVIDGIFEMFGKGHHSKDGATHL